MFTGKITLKETDANDLDSLLKLRNSGDVMRYAGFPDGPGETMEHLRSVWLPWSLGNRPKRRHYSVYAEGVGYCGEAFYDVDDAHGSLAAMDIKLLPEARGKGIACAALSYALEMAFSAGGAARACVDPHPDNEKALALCRRLGFRPAARPQHLQRAGDEASRNSLYLEITAEQWRQHRSRR